MKSKIGRVAELVRYPVKSMAGASIKSANIGWHGLQGDRRFAFRRLDNTSGFPWLTASRLPGLILYRPSGVNELEGELQPAHVLTPQGNCFQLLSKELRGEISDLLGSGVEMMQLKQGIFDDAVISVINLATITHVCDEAGVNADSRRFRPNIVLECDKPEPFAEDGWVGGMLVFGNVESGPAVQLTKRDERCVMINLDPETGNQDPDMLKATVRLNDNHAGLYGTVVRVGQVNVGDPVTLVEH